MLQPKDIVNSPSWIATHIQNNVWAIQPRTLAGAIACTGAAVNHDFSIKVPFSLLMVLLQSVDASDVLSTDALTWSFNLVGAYGFGAFPNPLPFVEYVTTTVTDFIRKFEDAGIELSPCALRFIENSTITDKVFVTIVIEVD